MGNNPSRKEAIRFFNDLGVDGDSLKEMVNKQHNSACKKDNNRDFAHECAMYSVMANESLVKSIGKKLTM